MLRATLFYPVDSYPLDGRFIHWIGLIHWVSYPPFEQPAPEVLCISSLIILLLLQNTAFSATSSDSELGEGYDRKNPSSRVTVVKKEAIRNATNGNF